MKLFFRWLLQGVIIFSLCVAQLLIIVEPAYAATCTWTGNTSRAWSVSGNWDCGHIPNSSDDVIIADVGLTKYPLITTTTTAYANSLTVNSGGVLEATGAVGVIDIYIQSGSFINNGTIKITDTIESAAIRVIAAGTFNNNGLIDVNAGTFRVNTGSAGGTHTGTFSGTYGWITLLGDNAGTMTFLSSSVISVAHIYFSNYPTVSIYGTLNQASPGSTFSIERSTVNYFFSTFYKFGTVYLISGGQLNITFNYSSIIGSIAVPLDATLSGSGTITGDLQNEGTISPGTSPGMISVGGNYSQETTGVLAVELGGTTAGTEYDQLTVTGTAVLTGTLNVSLIAPFSPDLDDSFNILTYGSRTGEIETVNLPVLDPGLGWQVTYGPTSLNLLVVEVGGSISGTVTCSGGYSGSTAPIYVGLWTVIGSGGPDDARVVGCGDTYLFDELPPDTYYIDAFLDIDDSGGGPPDPGEPDVWYGAPDPLVVTGSENFTGIDLEFTGGYRVFMPLCIR